MEQFSDYIKGVQFMGKIFSTFSRSAQHHPEDASRSHLGLRLEPQPWLNLINSRHVPLTGQSIICKVEPSFLHLPCHCVACSVASRRYNYGDFCWRIFRRIDKIYISHKNELFMDKIRSYEIFLHNYDIIQFFVPYALIWSYEICHFIAQTTDKLGFICNREQNFTH